MIGLDGLDPVVAEAMLSSGELPNLARLSREGSYRRLASTTPAQTPVAWSSFATGANPGAHGIFDFLRRDPASYRPEIALHTFEAQNRFLPPRPVSRRAGTALWDTLGEAGIPSVVLRHPCTFPPPKSLRGRMLAGVGVPDVRGGFGTSTLYTSRDDVQAGEGEIVVPIRPVDGVVDTHVPGPRGRDGDLSFGITLRFDASRRRARVESEGKPAVVDFGEGEWSDWLRVRSPPTPPPTPTRTPRR